VLVRILLTGTAEERRRKQVEAELAGLQRAMLPAEHERRNDPTRRERGGDGLELDRFRPGANDQPYVRGKQPSP
jgi:hypothetical protein